MNLQARIRRLEREVKKRRPAERQIYIISSAFFPRTKNSPEPAPGDVVFIMPRPGEKLTAAASQALLNVEGKGTL